MEVIQIALETRLEDLRKDRSHAYRRCLELKIQRSKVDLTNLHVNQRATGCFYSCACIAAWPAGQLAPIGRASTRLSAGTELVFVVATIVQSSNFFY